MTMIIFYKSSVPYNIMYVSKAVFPKGCSAVKF